jgi:hypothetical protein
MAAATTVSDTVQNRPFAQVGGSQQPGVDAAVVAFSAGKNFLTEAIAHIAGVSPF